MKVTIKLEVEEPLTSHEEHAIYEYLSEFGEVVKIEQHKKEKLRDCPYIAKKCKSEDCKGCIIHETMRGGEDDI